MPSLIPRLCFTAVITASSLPAIAGQASVRLEEVQVTAGRIEQTTSDVATGVSVVDADEILSQAPSIATDLMRGMTGAFVQQTTPGQGVPIIRGLKGSEVLHLVDGMRLNNALFRNAPNQYVALVDARMLSRLEVVRGPSPSLYGGDAMGGVVQMITALPQTDVAPSFDSRAVVDYRSADEALSGHLTVNRNGRRIGWSTSMTYEDVGDRSAGGNRQLTDSAYTARAARTVLRALPATDHELIVDVQYLRQPSTPRHDELVAGFGQDEPASAVFSFEPNDRLFLHARHYWSNVNDVIDDLEFHLGFQQMHDDRLTRDTGSSSLRRERNKSELAGLTVQAHSATDSGHRMTYGVEAYTDEVRSSRTATDIVTGDSDNISSRFPDGSTMDSQALYWHDAYSLTERLELDAGARYSRFDVSLPEADRGVGAQLDVDDLTANVGALYSLRPGLKLVANLGRGFRPPNIFDLGALGPRPGNRFNIANTTLGSENVITGDLGLKYSGSHLVGEAMIWYSDYQDKIASVPTGDLDESGRTIVQSRNTASVELWGIETGMRYLSGDERIELSGVINYTRGDETDAIGVSQPADRVPPLNGELSATYRPHSDWWLETFIRFADAQNRLSDRDQGDPRIDPDGTAGWATLNFAAGWQPGARTRVIVRLGNLFDKQYREHGSGIDAPGRDLGLTLEARF